MYCTRCGSENRSGAKFCIYCGEKIDIDGNEEGIDQLEQRYRVLLEQSKRFESAVKLTEDIENLKKSINEILEETESEETVIENLDRAADTEDYRSDSEREIQYCPYCGFYVGDHEFCGRCGKKIER